MTFENALHETAKQYRNNRTGGTSLFENVLLQLVLALLVIMGMAIHKEVEARNTYRNKLVAAEKERDGHKAEAVKWRNIVEGKLETPQGQFYLMLGNLERDRQYEKLLHLWTQVNAGRSLRLCLIKLEGVDLSGPSANKFLPRNAIYSDMVREMKKTYTTRSSSEQIRSSEVTRLLRLVWNLDSSFIRENQDSEINAAVKQAYQAVDIPKPTKNERITFLKEVPSRYNLAILAREILTTLQEERQTQCVPLQVRLVNAIALRRLEAGQLSTSTSTDATRVIHDLLAELRTPAGLLPELSPEHFQNNH